MFCEQCFGNFGKLRKYYRMEMFRWLRLPLEELENIFGDTPGIQKNERFPTGKDYV